MDTSSAQGRWPAGAMSRRGLLILGGLGSIAATTGLTPMPSASATTAAQVDLDFENQSLGAPISAHAGASLGSAYAHSGSFGCRLDPTTNRGSVAYLELYRSGFLLGKRYATYSMYFRLVSAPLSSDYYMNLFEIGTTSTAQTKSQFTVYFRANRLVCDFNYSERLDIGPVPALGSWHLIQAVVDYGSTTYTAQVSYDGAPAMTLTSANDKTPVTVSALWLHYPSTVVDYTMDVDEIKMSTSDTRPDFFVSAPTPTPPAPVPASFVESFEGGAVGSQPSSANTNYDQTIGDRGVGDGTIAVAFASGGFRGQCAKFYNRTVASSSFGFLGKRVGQSPILYLRRYYKLDVLPTYRTSVLLYKWGGGGNGQLGGTHNGSFAFGGSSQSHRFTLVNNNTNTTVSRTQVPTNSWFRVEVQLDFSSGVGTQNVRLFLGANVQGTIPDETLSGPVTGTYTDYVEDGILTNPNVKVNVQIDEAANGDRWLGPA